jgi:hypothetical protein
MFRENPSVVSEARKIHECYDTTGLYMYITYFCILLTK